MAHVAHGSTHGAGGYGAVRGIVCCRRGADGRARRKTFSDTPILDRLHRRQPTITDLLTPRELDVLRLLATGVSNAAIAARIRITEDKVEYATQSIYTKLDIPRAPDQNPRVYAAIRWLQEMPEDGRSAAT